MLVTTTNDIKNKEIVEYKGIVFGEVINGINAIRDISANMRNFFGGRSGSYEKELEKSRHDAIKEMAERARAMGANAVIGVDIDYEALGANNDMLMVTATGTAVVIR